MNPFNIPQALYMSPNLKDIFFLSQLTLGWAATAVSSQPFRMPCSHPVRPLESVSSCQRVPLPILAVVLLCLIARLRLAAWLIHKQGSSTSRSRDRRNISTKTATQHLSWNRWVSLIHAHAGTHTRPQTHTRTHTRNDNENETYAKTTGS